MDRDTKQLGIDQTLLTKLKESGIINLKGNLLYIGNSWFKDTQTGVCYRVSLIDRTFKVVETRQSKAKSNLKVNEPRYIYTDIECIDCGQKRRISCSDKHQVHRCRTCQLKFRAKRRIECRLEKRKNDDRRNNTESPS